MTGSPMRTVIGGGLVLCGLLLPGAGGLCAAVAGADPDPGASPGHSGQSADAGPDTTAGGQPQQHESRPGKDPADGPDTDTDSAAGGKDDESGPEKDPEPTPDRAPTTGRPNHGWRPRATAAPDDIDPRPDRSGHPASSDELPGGDSQYGAHAIAPEIPEPSAPAPETPMSAVAQHQGLDPDDDDDDCGWPSDEAFWHWLISLFTPKPDTGTHSPGGSGGGGPSVPSGRTPGLPGWSSAPNRPPPEGVDAPGLGGIGADVEPPVAVPVPPPAVAPIPVPIVTVPTAVAPPSPSGPAIAVPAVPNSTETRHRPTRPELPAKSPVAPAPAPAGFRAGYATYLRSASIGEVAGLAGLGVGGLAALTAIGGLIGFRQAKAGLAVRAVDTARFLE